MEQVITYSLVQSIGKDNSIGNQNDLHVLVGAISKLILCRILKLRAKGAFNLALIDPIVLLCQILSPQLRNPAQVDDEAAQLWALTLLTFDLLTNSAKDPFLYKKRKKKHRKSFNLLHV